MANGGLYLLAVPTPGDLELRVGALGSRRLPAGLHLYTGSARRGLWQRVARHLRRDKARRWHADHLTSCPDVGRPCPPWPQCPRAGPGGRSAAALAGQVLAWPGVGLEALLGLAPVVAWRTGRDPAVVQPLDGGGLICWMGAGGWVHTQADEEGFARKCRALGLSADGLDREDPEAPTA